MAEQICPVCGRPNEETQRFCGNCGARLEHECPRCGEPNRLANKFCGNCGERLAESDDRTRAEERRWATVVFADLSGFTELSERTDPEEVRALADRSMKKLGEIVERYGGWVNRVIGDAVLAVFGAPVAHEDDAERAVRAALEMASCAVDNADEFGNLTLSIGINTGEMMLGPVGPEGARDPTVMGDAVNTAARLQSEAPSGGILVGEETYEATRRVIHYSEAPAFQAKGKRLPVRAWVPLEPTAGPAERTVSEAPLVGRQRELDLLLQLWDQVATHGRPQLVTVLAPPGIGKTRLTREFIARAGARRVVRGRSLPYGEMTGYGAFAEQLKDLAGVFDSDAAEDASEKVERLAERLLPRDDVSDVASQLKVVLGLAGDALHDRQVLFVAARRLVEAVAREEPTIFVFEDIHWADSSLLDLIESLAGRAHDAAALFLTLSRPELHDIRPSWGGGLVSYTALPLEPLGEANSRELARHLLRNVDAEPFVNEVSDRADGNPLFIEELAASVTERTEEIVGRLPTNVQGIIAARLDSLPNHARSVLLDAAVVGKVFWRGALHRMRADPRLDDALDLLEARDFVRREASSSFQGDTEFTFKHMLIREVAYATLPKAARRERHADAAEYVEDAAGGRAGERASLLAHHWKEAGESEKAVEYLLAAAEQAQKSWAQKEAADLLRQALELVPDGEVERRRSLQLAIAHRLYEAGDFEGTVAVLDPLVPELEASDLAEATFLRGVAAFWLQDVETVKSDARVLSTLVEAPSGQKFRGPALHLVQIVAGMDGRMDEAIDIGGRAMAAWTPGHLEAERLVARGLLGINMAWVGRFAESEAHSKAAYEQGAELQVIEAVLNTGAQRAVALTGLGRHEEALSFVREILDRWREFEAVPRLTGRALNMWAGTLRELYLLDEARDKNNEAIECGKRAPFQNAIAQGTVDLLYADLAEGEVGKASSCIRQAQDEAEKLRGWHEWLVGARLLEAQARIAIETVSPEVAAEAAAASIEFSAGCGRLKYEIGSRIVLGTALERLGREQEAVAELRRALSDAERMAHPPTLWRAAAALARLCHATGNDDEATRAHDRARRVIESFAAGLTDEHRRVLLDAPEVASILATA